MVGAHFNLVEFLDKNRAGMSSTFLTRLRVGETLVDAKGVSRLYRPGIGAPGIALFALAFVGRRRDRDRLARDRQRLRTTLDQDQGRVRWLIRRSRPRRPGACESSPAMGYSGRYHAASLAAVFIALAVGILIGIGLADDVVSSASEELEASLRSDLQSAEDQAAGLQTQLDRSNRFGTQIVPEVLAGRLAGRRVALVELGGTDEAPSPTRATRSSRPTASSPRSRRSRCRPMSGDRRRAPAVRRPAARRRLAEEDRRGGRSRALRRRPDDQAPVAGPVRTLQRQPPRRRRHRDRPDPSRGPEPEAAQPNRDVRAGILDGAAAAPGDDVGAELTSTDPSTLGPFIDAGIPTVDHLDLPAGAIGLVYALDGLEGNFGIKGEAELPAGVRPRGAGSP